MLNDDAHSYKKSESWFNYYSTRKPTLDRALGMAVRHRYLLNQTINEISSFSEIIEIGVGIGYLGFSLYKFASPYKEHLKLTQIDYSQKLIDQAKLHINETPDIKFICADTFKLKDISEQFDLQNSICFHQGLLEHFSDEDVYEILENQLTISKTIFCSIPSKYFDFKAGLRGDERLLSLEEWTKIIGKKYKVKGDYFGEFPGERYHIFLRISRKE